MMYSSHVAARVQRVEADHVFGVIIRNCYQISKFPFSCFLVRHKIGGLHVNFFVLLYGNEINFQILLLPHVNVVL